MSLAKAIFKRNNLLFITYTSLFLLTVVYIYINCNYHSTWYDEGFSLHIIKHSYLDIWSTTAGDVHPPLYYWILKVLSTLFGDSIILIHFYSAIPVVLTFFLAMKVISRIWDHKTAIVFILFVLLHHATTYIISDIRMYSWAAFFVLASFVYGWKYITDKSPLSLFLLTLFSVCAAYTHYYALLAIFYNYIFLIIYAFLFHRKISLYITISAIISAIIYFPWLHILLNQVATVTDNYWITGIYWEGIIKTFSPFSNHVTIGLLLIGTFIAYIIVFLIKKGRINNLFLPVIILLLSIAPAFTGIVYSFLFRPVFVERYLYCSILLFILGFSILVASLDFRKKRNIALLIALCISIGITTFYSIQLKTTTNFYKDSAIEEHKFSINQSLSDSSAFIYRNHYHGEMPMWQLMYPNVDHVCKIEPMKALNQILDLTPHTKFTSYSELPSKYKTLYFIDTNGYSLLASTKDSIEITKYYDITKEENYYHSTLFELTRKEQITDSIK